MATDASKESLDYQHFIDFQLARAQGRIKSVEVGTAFVRLMTAAMVYVLVVIVLDHAFALPGALRIAFLLAALASGLGYFFWAVLLPSMRRINNFYTARTLEQTTPEMKNSLINFLDLRRQPERLSKGVLDLLEERAVADLSQIHVEEKISQERRDRAVYVLAAAAMATCVAVLFNALFMHRSLADSLGRALLPAADIEPPTKTRLIDIKPGNDAKHNTVIAHESVIFSAIAEGREPEHVTMHWSDDGGRYWREQELKKPDNQFEPWATDLIVEKPLRYYLVAGDCRTKEFGVQVSQAPMVTELELAYDYPEYTGWARHTSSNGNIDALEGTTMTITATTNQPPANGQIRFDSKVAGPAMQPVAGNDRQITTRFQVTKNDTYVIWFESKDGRTNPRPTSYEIKVRTDLPPTVTAKPGADQVDPPLPANAIVPIGVTARDDFGIEQATLHIAQGQETLKSFDLTDGQSPGKEFTTTHRLDLAALRLGNGDEIAYWIDVADNRQPKRNRASTPRYRIRLGSPLSPEEREGEEKRHVELAQAEDAAKAAAKTADSPAEQPGQPPANPTTQQQEQMPGDSEKSDVPKDKNALDVIRKYLEEKDRQERGEQARESGEKKDGDNGNSPDQKEQQPGRESTQDEKQEKKGDRESGEGKSGSEGKASPDGSKSDALKPEGKQPSDAQKGEEKSGGNKSGNEKTNVESPANEKGDGGKSDGEKGTGQKPNAAKDPMGDGSKGKEGDMPGDEKPGRGKPDGEKADSEKPGGAKQSVDEPGRPSNKGDKSGSEPAQGERAETKKTDDRKQADDKQTGNKSASDPQSGIRKSGDKSSDEKTAAEKSTGEKGRDEKTSDSDQPGGKKDSNEPKGTEKSPDKADGDMPSNEKSEGNKAQANKSGDEKSTDEKPGADKPGGDKAGGDKAGGDKAGGDKAGGDKAGGDKAGGDKAGGDKAGGDKAGGDKAGGDKAGGDKAGGDKAGGDKAGGDKAGGEKGGSGKSEGGKGGGSKSESKGSGAGQSESQGKGAASSSSNSKTGGGGGDAPGGQTERPQPGGGPNPGKGPVRPNDPIAGDSDSKSAPKTDYSNEGSDLVLERIGQQLDKGDVDPDLLKRLGWSREELEQFVKDFQGPGSTSANKEKPGSKPGPAKKSTNSGKTTLDEKRVKSVRRGPGETAVDALSENFEGRRSKAPPEYEDQVRAYNMSQSKEDKSTKQPEKKSNPSQPKNR